MSKSSPQEIKAFYHQNRRRLKNLLTLFLALTIFLTGVVAIWLSTFKIPTLDSFEQRKVTQSTKIYDRTGEVLLFDVFENVRRTVVPFEDISPNIKNASLAIEDYQFYEHRGIQPKAILRAISVNLLTLDFSQGGSTITQQVVKNSLLTTDKKISRKLKEWILALKLEKILTKDEILNIYLNEIPYGGSIYGVEEASHSYYGKTAKELTIAESAYLAAMAKAPSYYSPYGNNYDKLEERKTLVLREMKNHGFINEEDYEQALTEVVEFRPREDGGIKAPHFVMFVRDYLTEKYGENALEEQGLEVITTLDYELQQKGEEIVKRYALENEEKFRASNAALVATDPKTGQILTMVGSRDYFDEEIDGNFNIATAERQPGSAFKPFAYAEAFNKGFTTETVLFDLETQFSTNCEANNLTSEDGCYSPKNYDEVFRGPVTMRNALAQSINVPAVKTLYLAGITDTIRLARRMGIQTLENPNRYGLTLVLGGGEVTLLDITSAYGVFANEGVKNDTVAILEIRDRNSNVIEKFEPNPQEILAPESALKISNILNDNAARTPLYGSNSLLYFPGRDVAGKTGTTNDYRDVWTVGYTPNIAVGAWAGNNDNSSMEKKISGLIITPLWRAFMDEALKTLPNESFRSPVPENSFELKPVLRGKWLGGESLLLDKISGGKATEYTPPQTIDEKLFGGVHSILYWVSRANPRGESPSNPEADPQFELWEYPVRLWRDLNGFEDSSDNISIPDYFDNVHTPDSKPLIKITNPINNQIYQPRDKIGVVVSYQSKNPIQKIEYFINGSFIGESNPGQSIFYFVPQEVGAETKNTLKVLVFDSIYNSSEEEIEFNVSF